MAVTDIIKMREFGLRGEVRGEGNGNIRRYGCAWKRGSWLGVRLAMKLRIKVGVSTTSEGAGDCEGTCMGEGRTSARMRDLESEWLRSLS